MICFDNDLLADYLDGRESAERFLGGYESELWAIPSVALFECYMGAIYGRPRGSIEDVREATSEFEILPVTDDVAYTAAVLQRAIKQDGIELGFVDALLAATAAEAEARFATNDGTLLNDTVASHVDVIEYDR